MLTPDDLKQITEAILSTPQMKWCESQMNQAGSEDTPGNPGDLQAEDPLEAGTEPPPPGAPTDATPPDGAPASPNAGAEPGADDMSDLDDLLGEDGKPGVPDGQHAEPDGDEAGGDVPIAKPEAAPVPEENEKKPKPFSAKTAGDASVDRYAALEARFDKMADQLSEMSKGRADALRKLQISKLHAAYPQAVEVQREETRCLYSMGANMSDNDFTQHLADVEHYASRTVPNVNLPEGEMPTKPATNVDRELYHQRHMETALEVHRANASKGVYLNHDQIKAEVAKVLGPPPQ